MNTKLRIGLYGHNGHQIGALQNKEHPDAVIAAVCDPKAAVEELRERYPNAEVYGTLEQMLEKGAVDLVSICSPMRCDQKADALQCIAAGAHVYAEKPAVLSEADLDEVLAAADAAGVEFHEMADTVFYPHFWALRQVIRSGRLGQVVQVYAQKCYPSNFHSRPQDEDTDGGLIRWVGVHGVRFIEHVTGLKVQDVQVTQTHAGNGRDDNSGIFTASNWNMTLENGALAAMCCNYLRPKGFPVWGKEGVEVFCTGGIAEVTDGGLCTHVYSDVDEGALDVERCECPDFLGELLSHLKNGTPLTMTREEAFHPTRVVLRAFENANVHA